MLIGATCVASDCAEAATSKHASDDVAARRLWDESVRLVKLANDEMHPIVR